MKFSNPNADTFVPDGRSLKEALARTTHLGIGAHQDDLEFMAFHGIAECFHSPDKWFGGIVCADGRGSSRTGPYANHSDEAMVAIRREEQRAAASVGRYSAMLQLDYTSAEIKNPQEARLTADLLAILKVTKAEVVYTHQPADKHDTHLGVLRAVLQALRQLPAAERPKKVIGCEVWRGLDWMLDEHKMLLNVGGHENIAAALNAIFDSQIAGGKRYDLAVIGRRKANATFLDAHSGDEATEISLAMDLTPLIQDDAPDVTAYTLQFIDSFRADVAAKLSRQFGS